MQYLHHLGIFRFTMNVEGYCIALPKPRSNTIPAPYCDNILNLDTNEKITKLIILICFNEQTKFHSIPSFYSFLVIFNC
jgi:hypothetical protein